MILTSNEIFKSIENAKFIGFLTNETISSYHIDSRSVLENCAFFAFNGEKVDGHDFIYHAIKNGSKCIIAERLPKNIDPTKLPRNVSIIIVEDIITSIQKVASFARSRMKAKIVCVTGSIGKTTTKEMIGFVLQNFISTYTSPGNKNNHIGMPLSLLNAKEDAKLIILELGMNSSGEISMLSKIAKPDISIITTIAPAHIGRFNSLEDIASAKAEIIDGMNENGILILNQTNSFFKFISKKAKDKGIKTIIGLGDHEKSPIYMDNFQIGFNSSEFDVFIKSSTNGDEIVKTSTMSISHSIAFNSIFIFALAKLLRLDCNEVSKYLKKFKGVDGRGNIEKIKSGKKEIIIINDCYNSSPESVKSGIQTLVALKQKQKNARAICVLGDMLELGDFSYQYHRDLGNEIANMENVDGVICVGSESKILYDALPENKRLGYYENTEIARRPIRDTLQNEDIVLFKASRGIHLETVIEKLFQS